MNAQAAVRWAAPGLSAHGMPAAPAKPVVAMPSVEELERIHESARADGYAAGHAEGLAAAQAEMRRLCAQVEGILDSFTRPLARLDAEVADALAETATHIAGVLVGQAYAADPLLLADLVREALDAVGGNGREVELRLHPDDLGVLTPHLMALDAVRLTADTTLARGELRVYGEGVRIDGTLAARLQGVLAGMTESAP